MSPASAVRSVRVKVCGVTRLEDALAAVALGADALGFNFWPRSTRYCPPRAARAIVARLPPLISVVGVFVNQRRSQIDRIVEEAGLSAVQLHGDEPPEQCRGYRVPVIKALRADAESIQRLARDRAAAVLLDTPSRGYGGSGRAFDWALLKGMELELPVILAGGLTPGNVARAVAAVKPYAVDVASGVESAPGIKDRRKMARFISAAKGVK